MDSVKVGRQNIFKQCFSVSLQKQHDPHRADFCETQSGGCLTTFRTEKNGKHTFTSIFTPSLKI